MESKLCTGCNTIKSLSDFHKRTGRAIGVQNKCKSCKSELRSKHYIKNKEKENSQHSLWSKSNPANGRYHANKRRALKLQRTPSLSNLEEIALIYKQARSLERLLGMELHVDHIYPLQSAVVSGLHVPANLQITTKEFNLKKGNEMPVSLNYLERKYGKKHSA